uniref:Transmembrane protein n=1 Tax=Apophlaea sinclairii TaxID=212746 RepID=A0A1C9CBN4_9FLOR|nr:hypothetical protein Apop_097 [Apophlaea sinclairii]AOM65787.1 hypothetical protein Apop_097 [Apophlaea sinclairii]
MNTLTSKVSLDRAWPNYFNEDLDKLVAYVLYQTRTKLMFNSANKSNSILALDLIIPHIKKKLLILVLQEFENLLLDIVEFGLDTQNIHVLNSRILYNLLCNSANQFIYSILYIQDQSCFRINTNDLYVQSVLSDSQVIVGNLIIYLVFGASHTIYTSFLYIEILLQNLVIKVSDLVIYLIINQKIVYKEPVFYAILAPKFSSVRSIERLQNNLTYQNLKYFYIDQPNNIYSNKYCVFIISSLGLLNKTLSISRINELKYLSYSQLLFPSLLEIQDFLLPKLKYLVILLGKMIIYFGLSIISNSFKILLQVLNRSFINQTKD